MSRPTFDLELAPHPALRVYLQGPVDQSVFATDGGDIIRSLEKISRAEAQLALGLLPPDVRTAFDPVRQGAFGTYHADHRRFELRFPIERGERYYVLHLDEAPNVNSLKLQGLFFGYPACCAAFEHLPGPSFRTHPMSGTGFVPCPTCQQTKSQAELLQHIADHRHCPTPFPEQKDVMNCIHLAYAVLEGRLEVPYHAPPKPVKSPLPRPRRPRSS